MQPTASQSQDNPIFGSTQDAAGSECIAKPRSSRSSVASNSLRSERSDGLRRSSPHYVGAGRKVSRASSSGKLRKKGDSHRSQVNGQIHYRDARERRSQLTLYGQPTGWAAMANAVRNFDEEKVKDCKEDVDTLLVFAGLFSAVLTAFLIESYQNLLEDPATQSLLVLRQIALQTSSYNLQAGMLNSTASPFAGETFKPSAADIRVNVLWFASLLFSLVTASFGILVKQWLREFLAAENPSPQARLRLRHLRYPQLVQWKVFEIAAVLPLLLQLALALFFAGLCFFTASVHASVEYTTLPLVLGWTFCFCTVTVLPLFLPHCPYRTAWLKTGVQSFHRFIGRVAKAASMTCRTILSRSPLASQRRLKERLLAKVEKPLTRWSAFLADQDEARMMTHTEKDIEILGTVDSIQSDDELLNTAIAEAMDNINCKAKQFEQFLRTILVNRGFPSAPTVSVRGPRGPRFLSTFPVPILNLREVSKQTRNAICTLVSHYATNTRYACGNMAASTWAIDSSVYQTVLMCMIMLALSDCPYPEDGLHLVRGSRYRARGPGTIQILLHKALNTAVVERNDEGYDIPEDKAQLLLEGLGKLWGHLDVGTGPLLDTVFITIIQYGGISEEGTFNLPYHRPRPNVDDWPLDHLPPQVACDLVGLLLVCTESILRQEHGTFTDSNVDLPTVLRAVIRLLYFGKDSKRYSAQAKSFDFILSALLAQQDLASVFVDALLNAPLDWVRIFARRFPDRLATSHPTYGIRMHAFDWNMRLDNFTNAVSTRLADTERPMSNADALKLCYFATVMSRFLVVVQPPREKWAILYNALLDRIDGPAVGDQLRSLNDDKAAVADHMLTMLFWAEAGAEGTPSDAWTRGQNGDDELYEEWSNSWREEYGLVPERLIRSIAPYTSSPLTRMRVSWRVRRALESVRVETAEQQLSVVYVPLDKSGRTMLRL